LDEKSKAGEGFAVMFDAEFGVFWGCLAVITGEN
jgi:hypothetical protein